MTEELKSLREQRWQIREPRRNGSAWAPSARPAPVPHPERPPMWMDLPGCQFTEGDAAGEMKAFTMYQAAYALAESMLNHARRSDEPFTVGIAGDYDADGICSTAVLKPFVDYCYNIVSQQNPPQTVVFTPTRAEGHGINYNDEIAGKMAKKRVNFLLVPDSAINARRTIGQLRARGIRTVILDHHEPEGQIAQADFVINPHLYHDRKRHGGNGNGNGNGNGSTAEVDAELAPYGSALPDHADSMTTMTGAGLSWVFCNTMAQAFEDLAQKPEYAAMLKPKKLEHIRARAHSLLHVAAIGTIGDRAKLQSWPNDYIVRHGLAQLVALVAEANEKGIDKTDAPGLLHLMEAMGIDFSKFAALDPETQLRDIIKIVEFSICPPINAANRVGELVLLDEKQFPTGRVGRLNPALECLLAGKKHAPEMAKALVMLNGLRRDLQELTEVFKQVPSFAEPLMVATIPGRLNFSWKHVRPHPSEIPFFSEKERSVFGTSGLAGLIASDLSNAFAKPAFVFSLSWQKATHKDPENPDTHKDDERKIAEHEGYNLVEYDRPGQRYSATASCRNADEGNYSAFRFSIADFIRLLKREGLVSYDAGGGHEGAGGFKVDGDSPEEVLGKIERIRELACARYPNYAPVLSVHRAVAGAAVADSLEDAGGSIDSRKTAIKDAFGIAKGESTYYLRKYLLKNIRLVAVDDRAYMDSCRYRIESAHDEAGNPLNGMIVEIEPAKASDLIARINGLEDAEGRTPPLSMIGFLKKYKGDDKAAIFRFEPLDCFIGDAQALTRFMSPHHQRQPQRERL